MADITVTGLNKYYGAQPVLLDISFDIFEGEKVALVGGNGAGKTTLFKIIAGTLDYDSGDVFVAKNKKLGIIDQIPTYPEGFTVTDVIKTAFSDIDNLKTKARQLEKAMEDGDKSDSTLKQYGDILNIIENSGGYDNGFEIDTVCRGLNISDEMRNKPFNILSGGEKTREIGRASCR